MNDTIVQYWNAVKQYWQKYNRNQKLMFLIIIVIFAATIAIITYKMTKIEYANAFTDLQPSDAAAITDYLKTSKIPYQLSTDGKTIGVPKKQVADVKLSIESQGLNKSGSLGLGDFNGNNFGMTDRVFDVKYLNAIQGELEQLIGGINGVDSSRVLITLPANTVFLNDQNKDQSTAAVVVRLKPGYSLNTKQIDTMYHLVSHAVKNLPIDNITISDQGGNQLSSSQNSGSQLGASVMTDQFKITQEFKKEIESNVSKLLGAIYGRDSVIVSAFPTINFDKKKSHQQLVTPSNQQDQTGIAISLEKIQKSSTNSGSDQGGVPGTGTTSVPGYQGSASSGKSSSDESSQKINYAVNQITNDIVSTPYVVEDLTVNVGIEPSQGNSKTVTQEMVASTNKFLANIIRVALADNGKTYSDAEIANKASVIIHTFAKSTAGTSISSTNSMLLYGGLGAGVVALLGALGFLVIRRRRKSALAAMDTQDSNTIKPDTPSIDLATVTNDNQVRKQLESLAKKKPDQFVDLLRTWLLEE